jgi:Zn-dependent protease
MWKEIKLGKLAGLSLSASASVFWGSLVLWVLLSLAALLLLDAPSGMAILGGLIAVALHWLSDVVHHLGHAWAARRTGYPMSGVRFWGLLGTSLYPPDEPELPARLHIQRALGGPASSLLLALAAVIIAIILVPLSEMLWWLGAFLFLDNLLIFTLGALVPMGFTDGSTLLKWWSKR